jgi:hypothetical protein
VERTIASSLKALAWVALAIGAALFVWFVFAALQGSQLPIGPVAPIVTLLAGTAFLFVGAVLWAALMMLGFTLDAVIDIRDRPQYE